LLIILLLLFTNKADGYQIFFMEMTAYAPLDTRAQEGVCYSGNRHVTASGRRTTPGISVAMDKNIPFGTWVYIFGIGLRRVDDRGGDIGKGKIDLCVWTQEQAYSIGRRKALVWILNSRKDREAFISVMQKKNLKE
jgi:3D (Asp-Asp-Asp) domain-containing protein